MFIFQSLICQFQPNKGTSFDEPENQLTLKLKLGLHTIRVGNKVKLN